MAEDINPLGKQGDIVRVKPGYARNFLIPQGLATVATERNKRMVESHRERQIESQKQRVKEFKRAADALKKYSVTLEAQANPDGHLYGSINAPEIAKSLVTAGFDIVPDQIRLEGPLKELGLYTVKVHLHGDIDTEVKVWVVPHSTT